MPHFGQPIPALAAALIPLRAAIRSEGGAWNLDRAASVMRGAPGYEGERGWGYVGRHMDQMEAEGLLWKAADGYYYRPDAPSHEVPELDDHQRPRPHKPLPYPYR